MAYWKVFHMSLLELKVPGASENLDQIQSFWIKRGQGASPEFTNN